jgi:hypothetical protein
MALVVARQETGSHERWPKVLKGELENNIRKPMDLVRKLAQWQPKKVQLILSQGKKMMTMMQ